MKDVTFGALAVGDKFLVRNYVSGEVRPDCPVREKIVPFDFKTGRPVNAKYQDSRSPFKRVQFDLYQDDDEVVLIN